MKKEEWKQELFKVLKERDKILKKQQRLKCIAQIDNDSQIINNTIVNELYDVQKQLNHYDFMLNRLMSDEVFDSIEHKIKEDKKEDYFERIRKARTIK